MTAARSRLDDALAAARVASERAELWLPGAMAWLATLGWIPFLAAVGTLPSEGDLAVFGAGLVTSGGWPLNGLALAAGLVAAMVAALALLALGEVALSSALRRRAGAASPAHLGATTLGLLGVEVVAAGPVAFAALALAAALASAAPDEFQSPDIGGALGLRILGRIGPFLAALAVALLACGAFAAAAGRRVLRGHGTLAALRGGARDVWRAPGGLAAVALATTAVSLGYLVASWLLLRVLWAPIAAQLAGSGIIANATPLLVGFVAIWLCLLAGGGAVYAWASVWWTLELSAAGAHRAVPASTSEESGVT